MIASRPHKMVPHWCNVSLAFCRQEPLAPTLLAINTLITDSEVLLRCVLPDRIEVLIKLLARDALILVDGSQFETVLLNLAINARDAMLRGGTLTISIQRQQRTLTDSDERTFVVVTVADTGSGMTPEVVERACEPFFTTKSRERGTGLGLSMAYGFATQALGVLEISSTEGVGTTVKLSLPQANGELDTQPPETVAEEPNLGTELS